MKITAFYPAVITDDAEKVVEKMKKFGFNVIHQRIISPDEGVSEYVMASENNQRTDVVCDPTASGELHAIRVNVDDFDEAVKMYGDEGFTVVKGPSVMPDTKNVRLAAPGKPLILLMQHIKKD